MVIDKDHVSLRIVLFLSIRRFSFVICFCIWKRFLYVLKINPSRLSLYVLFLQVARGRGIGMRGVGGGRGAMARGAPRGIRGGPRGAAAGRGGMRGGPGSRGAPRGMGPPNNGGMGKRKAQGDTNPGQSKKPRSQDNWGAQPIAQQPLNDQQWYQDSFDANTWG